MDLKIWTLLSLSSLLLPTLPAQSSPYAKWKNGPSSDPGFFPIAVWLQSPRNAPRFQSIGINTFVGLWKGPTGSQLQTLGTHRMPVLTAQNPVGLNSKNRTVIRGWTHDDEPDNAQPKPGAGYGPPVLPSTIVQRYTAMRKADPTRPVFLNFGQGVANEKWIGRGTRTGKLEDYPEYIKGADIISFDIYPVTHRDPRIRGRLEFVARGVERLVAWSNGSKIVWNVVECTHINSTVMPTPDEVRAEVWMSLIHGSMGIVYFVHEWYPRFREPALLSYPKMTAAVQAINAEIKALAPVLNSPTIVGVAKVASSKPTVPVSVMMKRHGGATWLFTVGMRRDSTRATFTLTGLPPNAIATVLGEERTIPVIGGTFQDDFAPYGTHLYRIMANTLNGTPEKIKLSAGGTQTLLLAAGSANANRDYWVFGSLSGTFPGTRVGTVHAPLTYDALTSLTLASPNTVITASRGQLDARGGGAARLIIPRGLSPAFAGLHIHTAFLAFHGGAVQLASNPTTLELTNE